MKRAIVTGGSGFIGGWLITELLNNGYEVIAVVRNKNRLLPEIKDSCFCIEKEISELAISDFQDDKSYDVFFHLAWGGVSSESKNDISLQIKNIEMAMNAIQICSELSCRKFISAGTVAEYALSTDVMDLKAKQTPNDMYGVAKTSAYFFLDVRARQLNQPFIWTVIPSTFGERRSENNIISYTINTLLKDEKPRYGNLEQMWDFLYVGEVARAMRLIAERGKTGKVYGIGSGTYRTLREYIEKIRDIIDPELPLGIGENLSLLENAFSSCVNIYDLIKDTEFIPEISFEKGIKNTVKYYKAQLEKSGGVLRNRKTHIVHCFNCGVIFEMEAA